MFLNKEVKKEIKNYLETNGNGAQHTKTMGSSKISFKSKVIKIVVVVQALNHILLFEPMDCSTPGFPVLHCISWSLNSCPPSQRQHPTISSCYPLFLLPSIFPSTRVFSNESALHIRWPKYWHFSSNRDKCLH